MRCKMSNTTTQIAIENAMNWFENLSDVDKIEIYCEKNNIEVE